MGNIRQAIVRLEGLPRKEDHMNIRTLKQAWWHGRVARSLSVTALATVPLAASAASVAAKPPPEPRHPGGQRAFNAGNACADAQGYIFWRYGEITLDNVELRNHPRGEEKEKSTRHHLYLKWEDEDGKHNKLVTSVGAGGANTLEFDRKEYRTSGMPRKALASVCSTNCKGKWKCGRPG
jgi:hypothetical protein